MPQVRDEGVLVGLARRPMGDLSHAYGPAGDVPGLLRAIASGDAKAADDAVLELFGTSWHQVTVHQATPYAVPFLARMVAAGIRPDDLVQLLGCLALATAPGAIGRAAWDGEQFADQYRVPVLELTAALERLTPGPEASRMVNWLQERLGPGPSAAAANAWRPADREWPRRTGCRATHP